MPPDVTVIIPTLNRLDLLKAAVESFREHHEGDSYEIVVVENGNDSTEVWCKDNKVRCLKPDNPLPFGHSNNLAARETKSRFLLLLNNDTICTQNILLPMIATMEANPKCVMVGAKLVHEDGTLQHGGIEFAPNGIPFHPLYGGPADLDCLNFDRPVNGVTAACALVRRDAWEKVHGFDERYESNYEDVDLGLKFLERGWQLWFCHSAVMTHLENRTRGDSVDIKPMLKVFARKWIETKNLHYLRDFGKLDHPATERRVKVGTRRGCWPGYVNLDDRQAQGVDMARDIRRGLPFDTGTVKHLLYDLVLQTLSGTEVVDALDEAYRVLASDGLLSVVVPIGIGDPLARSFWNERSLAVPSPPWKVERILEDGERVRFDMRLCREAVLPAEPEKVEAV